MAFFTTRVMGTWARIRTQVLTIGGLGAFVAAAWDVGRPWGLLALAVSCFTLEVLNRGERR